MESEKFAAEWRQLGEEVLSGMRAWRKSNPQATLTEIELETDRRMSSLRARMVEEATHSSAAAEGSVSETPHLQEGLVRLGSQVPLGQAQSSRVTSSGCNSDSRERVCTGPPPLSTPC